MYNIFVLLWLYMISSTPLEELDSFEISTKISDTIYVNSIDTLEVVDYEKEVDYLAALIYSEAANQSEEGKLAVATVVLNRGRNIRKVVEAKGQFDGRWTQLFHKHVSASAWNECRSAATEVLFRNFRSFPSDVIYYHHVSPKYSTDTSHVNKIKRYEYTVIGSHRFCTKK